MGEDAVEEALECYGVRTVNKNGQVTVPAEARSEIGLDKDSRVILFGDPRTGRLIVMPAPPGSELLDFVTKRAVARRAPDGGS